MILLVSPTIGYIRAKVTGVANDQYLSSGKLTPRVFVALLTSMRMYGIIFFHFMNPCSCSAGMDQEVNTSCMRNRSTANGADRSVDPCYQDPLLIRNEVGWTYGEDTIPQQHQPLQICENYKENCLIAFIINHITSQTQVHPDRCLFAGGMELDS